MAQGRMIAAFDVATDTGGCDGAPGGKPRTWSWHLRDFGNSRPHRLLGLRNLLVAYFEEAPVDLVVYEAPLPIAIMNRIGAQDETVALLRGAIGVLEATCAGAGIAVEAVKVQDARQSVLGWRTNKGSKATKVVVLQEAVALGAPCETHNEADAWVIWQYACNRANPRLAVMQQPLFRGT